MRKPLLTFLSIFLIAIDLTNPALVSPVKAQTPLPPDLTRGEQYLPGSLIVGYRQNSGPRVLALPQAARVSEQTGVLQQLNAVVIDVPVGQEEQVRQELLQNPDVLYVERNGIVRAFAITPDDPFWDRQYGPQMIHMPDAWEALAPMTASPVTLAIIDSGLDTSHPDFAGRLVPGYDFVEKDNTPQDACGHGTHVAGIAAATGNNGIGIAGINWTARIMPVRVLDENCGGSFANLANGILYAVDHGANVINLSLGSLSASNLVESAVFQAYSRGVTIVAAAGNQQNGNGLPIIAYPAAYPWALAVGAVGKDRQRAGFSNYASEQDQRLVMAPGVDILSIIPGGNYQYMDGTSMATAHVSGAAALLAGLSQFNTPDKIFQAIYKTADSSIGPRAGWDNETGYGLVQIDLALNFSQFEPPPPLPTTNIDYDMVSSINCGELPYQWIDAASGGRFLLLNSNDARVQVDFSGGKQFTFGGQSYASVEVSANGYLRFGSSPEQAISDKTNDPIPAISQPNNFAAPFWADLSSPNGMQLYAKQEGDLFVVEWYKVSYQGYTLAQSELTFEVILNFNTGQIIYQYQTLKGVYADGALATVGVEYADGTAGSQYSYNRKGALKPGLAILFSPAEKGSTRTLQGCLFVTQAQFRGCNQLPPFGVDIFEGLLPPNTPTTLRIELVRQPNTPLPGNYIAAGKYARITLDPPPPTPFDPKPLVCYSYDGSDILKGGGHAENLFIASYDAGPGWQRLPTLVNTEAMLLTAPASHFSLFGIFSLQPERLPVTGAPLSTDGLLILTAAVFILLSGFLAAVRKRKGW